MCFRYGPFFRRGKGFRGAASFRMGWLGGGMGPWCWFGWFPTEEEELEFLEEYRDYLKEELAEVEKRISRLKKEKI